MTSKSQGNSVYKSVEPPAIVRQNRIDSVSAFQRSLLTDEDVRPGLMGVISVNIQNATLMHRKEDWTPPVGAQFFITVHVRNMAKQTRMSFLDPVDQKTIVWDQIKHVPIKVVRHRRHVDNLIDIRLYVNDPVRPEITQLVGAVAFHLHDVINASPTAGQYELWHNASFTGLLELEMTFSYGVFGYGYSLQLQEENHTPDDMARFSLLPRLNPPAELTEPDTEVLITKAVPHPDFIPFKQKVRLSYGREIGTRLRSNLNYSLVVDPEKFEDDANASQLSSQRFAAIETLRDQYYAYDDRMERLAFLYAHLRQSEKRSEFAAAANVTSSGNIVQEQNSDDINTTQPWHARLVRRFIQPWYHVMFGTSATTEDPANTAGAGHDVPQAAGQFNTVNRMRRMSMHLANIMNRPSNAVPGSHLHAAQIATKKHEQEKEGKEIKRSAMLSPTDE